MDQTKKEQEMSLAAGHRKRNVWPGQDFIWQQMFGWTNKMFICYVFITCHKELTSVIKCQNILKSVIVDY
jgi:hypothetical protein